VKWRLKTITLNVLRRQLKKLLHPLLLWLLLMYVHRQIRHLLSPGSKHHQPFIIIIIVCVIFLLLTSIRHVKLRHINEKVSLKF
jgi:hypothetical protein